MGIHSSSFTVNPVEKKEFKKCRLSKKAKDKRSAYDFVYTNIDGKLLTMRWFEGHPLIVVNVTAAECKNAEVNYTQLTELYDRYSEKGLRIIGFPCTQFNSQASETESNMQQIIQKYKVTFDIASGIDVNGDSGHPLWKYMKMQRTGGTAGVINGDFTKFLVDKQGKVVARFEPPVEPLEMEKDILALL